MKALAVDFDKTIHQYSRGWQGGEIYDDPFPECLEVLAFLHQELEMEIVIFTARGPEDWSSVQDWMIKQQEARDLRFPFRVTNVKDMNMVLFIDDRALRFEGDWKWTMEEATRLLSD